MVDFLYRLVESFQAGFGFGFSAVGCVLQIVAFLLGLGCFICLAWIAVELIKAGVRVADRRLSRRLETELRANPTPDYVLERFDDAKKALVRLSASDMTTLGKDSKATKELIRQLSRVSGYMGKGELREALSLIEWVLEQSAPVTQTGKYTAGW